MLRAQPPAGGRRGSEGVLGVPSRAEEGRGWHGHSLRENSSCAATVPSISLGLMRRVQSPSASVV